MSISGIGRRADLDLSSGEIEAVKMTTAPNANTQYYQDENPENTFTPYFNRAMREQQEQESAAAKKLRDLRASEDYKLLREQQQRAKVAHIIDTYR
jgi:hypothetical protein